MTMPTSGEYDFKKIGVIHIRKWDVPKGCGWDFGSEISLAGFPVMVGSVKKICWNDAEDIITIKIIK